MRNELSEAKQFLERACPLLELLPSTLMDTAGVGNGLNPQKLFQSKLEDATPQQNYAVECFSVLRKIYLRLYSSLDEADSIPKIGDGSVASDATEIPPDNNIDALNEQNNFIIDSKIEELRQPFQHLRSELMMLQDENSHDNSAPHVSLATKSFQDSRSRVDFKPSVDSSSSNSGKYRALFADSLHDLSNSLPALVKKAESADFASNYGESATTLIAADMAIMLRNFVHANDGDRHAVFEVARKYYQDLDVNFPSVS